VAARPSPRTAPLLLPRTSFLARAANVLRWPGFFFVVGLLGAVELGWLIPALILERTLPEGAARRIGRGTISFVFRLYFRITRACGVLVVDASEIDAIDPAEAMIIAPNHPSGLDALIIASRLPQLNCVMKASMLDNVFLGAGARLAGYIRDDGRRRLFRSAIDELRAGGQVIIFPEGSRTLAAPVNHLNGGLVLMAKVARVPIQTVIVETDTPFLSKGWSVLRPPPHMPMRYRLRLGRRFHFPPGHDLHDGVAELQCYFEETLAGVPLGRLWQRKRVDAIVAPTSTGGSRREGKKAPVVPSLTGSR
jgi:1-acyl-sn-glycerol-3-phosphate acyltransferase